ncbi:MAG: hypothetical protein H0T89_11000 [Deltaproteobacteria bacterium]|nr:hypothetical protein [Deltaproteobacteria bacterium]
MNRATHCALVGALAIGAACSSAEDAPPPPTSVSATATRPTPQTPPVIEPTTVAANVDCRTLTNPVYLPTTTLIDTLMRRVLPKFADGSPTTGVGPTDQMTVIQFPQGSCGAYEVIDQNLEISGTGIYFAAGNATPLNCDLPTGTGIKADFAAMDVGGQTCLGAAPQASMVEFPSHVETLGFVVPKNSTQRSITATEAYYVMKFAGEAGKQITPWVDPNFVHVRSGGSSTQLTIGANIGLSGTMWNALLQGNGGSSAVQTAVIADNSNGNHEKSLGILNSSKWESSLNEMRVLAFEPFNSCLGAVFPDSTSVARDKRNVRDGHYPIWTNLRYVLEHQGGAPFSDNGTVSATRAKRFIDIMNGEATATNLDVPLQVIQTGNIPACAMQVSRAFDGSDIKAFEHPAPCNCYFDSVNGVVNPNCRACSGTNPCPTGVCRSGFCEPR